MRLIYLDEAGIWNPTQESFLVVAGDVVDADKQFEQIEAHLDELFRKRVPEEKRDGVIFYALKLVHNNKRFPRHDGLLKSE